MNKLGNPKEEDIKMETEVSVLAISSPEMLSTVKV